MSYYLEMCLSFAIYIVLLELSPGSTIKCFSLINCLYKIKLSFIEFASYGEHVMRLA